MPELMAVLQFAGQVLVVAGALLFGTAGWGLLSLRDVYARSSALATAAGMGVSLILVGTFLFQPTWATAFKLVIAIVLQLATSAVGSMAIARSASSAAAPSSRRARSASSARFASRVAPARVSGPARCVVSVAVAHGPGRDARSRRSSARIGSIGS